jgi:predicted branched-subunit amino acid permease
MTDRPPDTHIRATRREFFTGAKLGLPAVISAVPFGLLFGAIAVDRGFSVFEATLMSVTIFGGASQMVGIELFGSGIAPWLVVLSIFAVNFRHVLYSAAVGRHFSRWPSYQQAIAYFLLTDPQYAETERAAERGERPDFIWYLGLGIPIYAAWVVSSAFGALFGRLITNPYALGLDFLLPFYFLALLMSFRARPRWLPVVLASGAASILAYKFVGSPWHVSLGAIAGVVLAAIIAPADAAGGREDRRA